MTADAEVGGVLALSGLLADEVWLSGVCARSFSQSTNPLAALGMLPPLLVAGRRSGPDESASLHAPFLLSENGVDQPTECHSVVSKHQLFDE